MEKLTSGEVAKIAGVPVTTIVRWVRFGWIDPIVSGEGSGHKNRFSLSQCVLLLLVPSTNAREQNLRG